MVKQLPGLNFYSKVKKNDAKFSYGVSARECGSMLEVPDGRNPSQNAWLTVTINYTIDFIDRWNPGGKAILKNNKAYVKDGDGNEFALMDWDFQAQMTFNSKFRKGEAFWNYKFLLITPTDYDGLDFTSMAGKGCVCRPNVICLFRLTPGLSPTHLTIKALRPERSFWDKFLDRSYRSDQFTYKIEDVDTTTLWHELGHALDQPVHILGLQGDPKCMEDDHKNDGRCYDSPNIMGHGSQLDPINARVWSELIGYHTDTPKERWKVTQSVNTPPRTIPLGVAEVAVPDRF
jgi:hypothetical protein